MSEKIDYSKNYKRTIFTWSLYDFANQPFPTIIITFIYSIFFTGYIADGYENADSMWLYAISISSIIIAILSPFMGAIADSGGYRKTFLILLTWVCIIGCSMLYFPIQGQVLFALILIIISNAGFELGSVFCNSYLPDIAPKEKIGRISGYGWSFGYAGGLNIDTLPIALEEWQNRDQTFWIDMETGVRSRVPTKFYDEFDLDKVVDVLELIDPYVSKE